MPGLSPSWVPTLCSGQLLFCLPLGLIFCPSPPLPRPLPLLCIFHHIHTDCRNYLPNISIHPFSFTYPRFVSLYTEVMMIIIILGDKFKNCGEQVAGNA